MQAKNFTGYVFAVFSTFDKDEFKLMPTNLSRAEFKAAFYYHQKSDHDDPYLDLGLGKRIDTWGEWTDGRIYATKQMANAAAHKQLKAWRAHIRRMNLAEGSRKSRKKKQYGV